MSRFSIPVVSAMTAAVLALALMQLTSGAAGAQGETCGGATVVVEGGDPSPFTIPTDEGTTLRLEPDTQCCSSAPTTQTRPPIDVRCA